MMWDGLERFTSTWFENLLLQQWIPAMPEVKAHLERGCDVADVGCGRGRAVIKLAQAFPRSRYVGYDNFGPTVARATENAREVGVSDRVGFEERDVSKGLPAEFDVITTFDVVHDAVDPLQLLRSIRCALRPGGIYVCLDMNCSDKLEENANPLGAMFHGVSVFYCMTTSLANHGAGLGTLGFHEAKVRELCEKAGFSSVRRVPLENPFNNLWLETARPRAADPARRGRRGSNSARDGLRYFVGGCNSIFVSSAPGVRSSPRRLSSGSMYGSRPTKFLNSPSASADPPRESNIARKRSPFSRFNPPCCLNHSTVSASSTSLQM
jgi:SAM-dependent methyltransferase